MICPYCHKNACRVIEDTEEGRVVRCGNCDALLEKEGERPTLKCPKCGQYSRNDWCSHCGYEFKEGIDY